MLSEICNKVIGGDYDNYITNLFAPSNEKIHSIFEKKDSIINSQFSISSNINHGLFWCFNTTMSGHILFTLTNLDNINKKLIFNVVFTSSYSKEHNQNYTYKFESNMIIDYKYKLITVNNIIIKYDYFDYFYCIDKNTYMLFIDIEKITPNNMTDKCKLVLEYIAKLIEFTFCTESIK